MEVVEGEVELDLSANRGEVVVNQLLRGGERDQAQEHQFNHVL
jgi:hypothetical protein